MANKYLTINDEIRLNGERHLANAVGYAAKGLFSYSDGSIRKAKRNFERASRLGFLLPSDNLFEYISTFMSNKIAESIMNDGQ